MIPYKKDEKKMEGPCKRCSVNAIYCMMQLNSVSKAICETKFSE